MQFNKKLLKCVPKPPKKVEVKAFSIVVKKKQCTKGEEWSETDESCKTKVTKKTVTITVTEETPAEEVKPKMTKKEVKELVKSLSRKECKRSGLRFSKRRKSCYLRCISKAKSFN